MHIPNRLYISVLRVSHRRCTTMWLVVQLCSTCVTLSSHNYVAGCTTRFRVSSILVSSHIGYPHPQLVGLPKMDETLMHRPWYPIGLCITDGSVPIVGIPISFLKIAAWYAPFLSLHYNRILPSTFLPFLVPLCIECLGG